MAMPMHGGMLMGSNMICVYCILAAALAGISLHACPMHAWRLAQLAAAAPACPAAPGPRAVGGRRQDGS